eukprot:179549-Chlamydomonas_euryale.AAC.7
MGFLPHTPHRHTHVCCMRAPAAVRLAFARVARVGSVGARQPLRHRSFVTMDTCSRATRKAGPTSRPRDTPSTRPLGLRGLGMPVRRLPARAALPELIDGLVNIAPHFPLAYEPVALPCSMMKCGDVVYRRCGGGSSWGMSTPLSPQCRSARSPAIPCACHCKRSSRSQQQYSLGPPQPC